MAKLITDVENIQNIDGITSVFVNENGVMKQVSKDELIKKVGEKYFLSGNGYVPTSRKILNSDLTKDLTVNEFLCLASNATFRYSLLAAGYSTIVQYAEQSEKLAKKEYVDALIEAITTIDIQVVDALPTENISSTTIYLIPKNTTEDDDIYDEYIYINDKWEHVGNTQIDLSNFVKITDYATNDGKAGIVKVNNGMYGIKNVDANIIGTNRATNAEIEALSNGFKPIVPSNLKKAVETIGGVIENLKTEDKTNYVNAINEVLKFATRERSWKKVRTITIPSDDYKGQIIDGVTYKYNISADGGIYRVIFDTDEDGNLLEDANITGAIIKLTPTTNININQGFISINSDAVGSTGTSIDYFTGVKNTTDIRWFEISIEPFRETKVLDNPGRYVFPAQYSQKQINKLVFGGFEAASVLGEGTKLEIWMFGYWDE